MNRLYPLDYLFLVALWTGAILVGVAMFSAEQHVKDILAFMGVGSIIYFIARLMGEGIKYMVDDVNR